MRYLSGELTDYFKPYGGRAWYDNAEGFFQLHQPALPHLPLTLYKQPELIHILSASSP